MGYKLVSNVTIPLPEKYKKELILKKYVQYLEKSKDENLHSSVRKMYEDYAHGLEVAAILFGYDIEEENKAE